MPEADVGATPTGALLVGGGEVGWKPHRPAALGIEADPERYGFDRRVRAPDRGPALGREPPESAAEGPQRELLAVVWKPIGANPRTAHDPRSASLEAGVDQVQRGDVL